MKFFNLFKSNSQIQNISVSEFKEKMKEKNTIILDVRTSSETTQGKIKGAKEMNVMSTDFGQKITKLEKSKTYLVYYQSGMRSRRACKMMEKAGFENLYNLSGGYTAWKRF